MRKFNLIVNFLIFILFVSTYLTAQNYMIVNKNIRNRIISNDPAEGESDCVWFSNGQNILVEPGITYSQDGTIGITLTKGTISLTTNQIVGASASGEFQLIYTGLDRSIYPTNPVGGMFRIEVRLQGTLPSGTSSGTTLPVLIDKLGINSCSLIVEASEDPVLFKPNSLLFTSGVDAFSRGLKLIATNPNQWGYTITESSKLIRPLYENDPLYWPFIARWIPISDTQLNLSPQYKTSNSDDVSISQLVSFVNPTRTEGSYNIFEANSTNYLSFLKLNDIKNSSLFFAASAGQGLTWSPYKSYVAETNVTGSLSLTPSVSQDFVIRQIQYGAEAFTEIGSDVRPLKQGGRAPYNYYKVLINEDTFKTINFTIRSNASWRVYFVPIGGTTVNDGLLTYCLKDDDKNNINLSQGQIKYIETPKGTIIDYNVSMTIKSYNDMQKSLTDGGFPGLTPATWDFTIWLYSVEDEDGTFKFGNDDDTSAGPRPFIPIRFRFLLADDFNKDESR